MKTDLTVKMDKGLAEDIESVAVSLGIARDDFLSCVVLDWRARTDAYREADGHAPRPMLEFIKPDDIVGLLGYLITQMHRWSAPSPVDVIFHIIYL